MLVSKTTTAKSLSHRSMQWKGEGWRGHVRGRGRDRWKLPGLACRTERWRAAPSAILLKKQAHHWINPLPSTPPPHRHAPPTPLLPLASPHPPGVGGCNRSGSGKMQQGATEHSVAQLPNKLSAIVRWGTASSNGQLTHRQRPCEIQAAHGKCNGLMHNGPPHTL